MPPQSDQDNYLLYILSHYGQVPWPRFKALFGELYSSSPTPAGDGSEEMEPPSLNTVRWRVLRSLEWLGHCQVSFSSGEGTIRVHGAQLTRLPAIGLVRAVLTGARGPATIQQLFQTADKHGAHILIDRHKTDLPFTPHRIEMQACSAVTLENIASALGIKSSTEPQAFLQEEQPTSVDSILNSSGWEEGGQLNWKRRIFDPVQRSFSFDTDRDAILQLHHYIDPVRGVARYYLIRHRLSRPGRHVTRERQLVDLDWGRYTVLQAHGQRVLYYHPQTLVMIVPTKLPLPAEIAQRLTLCSGFLPEIRSLSLPLAVGSQSSDEECFLFRWIPPRVALYVAERVGQKLTEILEPFEFSDLRSPTSHVFIPPPPC